MNRRRSPRRAASKEIALVVDSEHREIANHAFAVDLSELGARVRTPVHLEPGQRVTIIPREGKAYAIASRVIWVNEPEPDLAEAGLAFLQPQSSDAAFLASP